MYDIDYSEEAKSDMQELFYFIAYEKGMLATAKKYLQGLKDKIEEIAKYPTSFPISRYVSLLQYGFNVRRVNYNKMAIIYTVHDNSVYIHRVVAASMITGLN